LLPTSPEASPRARGTGQHQRESPNECVLIFIFSNPIPRIDQFREERTMMARSGSAAYYLSRICQSPNALDITDSFFPWFSRCMNTNCYQHESSIDIVCNTGSCGRSIPSQLEQRILRKNESRKQNRVRLSTRSRRPTPTAIHLTGGSMVRVYRATVAHASYANASICYIALRRGTLHKDCVWCFE